MITALVLLALASLIAIATITADRAAARLAERKASAAVSAPFGHPATVRVHGSPFLIQAARGRYTDIEVRGTLSVGEIAGAVLVCRLRNVHLSLRDLLARNVRELPCEHVRGRVVLPYAELARVSRLPGLTLRFEGGRLLAAATLAAPDMPGLAAMAPGLGAVVPGLAAMLPGLGAVLPGLGAVMPGIGQLARVDGEALLSLRATNEVWLQIKNVSVAGISLPAGLPTQLLTPSSIPIPLPLLPFGLRLDEVCPTIDGLAVDGSADAVVLRASAPSSRDDGDGIRPAGRPGD